MKFSIRDLFLVTVIVALVLGWVVDHRKFNADIEALEFVIDCRKGSGFQRIPSLSDSQPTTPILPQ